MMIHASASAADHRARPSAGAVSRRCATRSPKHNSTFVISYEAPGGLIVVPARSIAPFQAAGRGDTGRSSITPRALIRPAFPLPTICSSAASGVQPR